MGKKNILIFKTVNEERTKRLLKNVSTLCDSTYVVMPECEIGIYSKMWDKVHYIGTGRKYIDYATLMQENQIPDIKYHEIWIPSPQIEGIYTYGEVYEVISTLKYCKVYYKVLNEDNIETYDLRKEGIFSCTHDMMVRMVKIYMDLFYWTEKKIKGCK